MAETGQAPRRLPAPARRKLILEAARVAILEQGLAAVSVRDIARQAGISHGTVSHHFPSVDELLSAVLRAESARFNEARADILAGRGSALEGLFALGDRLFQERRDLREYWALWLDHWARAAHDPGLASWQAGDYRAWRELVASLVAEGIASGEFRDLEPNATAIEVVALIDGLALQAFSEVKGISPDDARVRFREAVQARLVRTEPAPAA